MPISSTNIKLSDIQAEVGYSGTTNISLKDQSANAPGGSSTLLASPYAMSEFSGYQSALLRTTMNADYWTIQSTYNTAYNSGYWGLGGQGVFDYMGNNQGYVSFSAAIGSATSTTHFVYAFRTYAASGSAPLIFILTLFNATGTSYSGGTTDIGGVKAYTNSDYSSGNILNVSTASGASPSVGFSSGAQTIDNVSRETATWTWTIGNIGTIGTVFGTNSGYQSGNGTHYVEILP